MVREYFKQLDLDKLPSKVSNYISNEILTDLGLDLLSEDDELFNKVKNKIDSILHKEELNKGVEVEQEHKDTLEEVAAGVITVPQAIEETAETHIDENPNYYENLEKVEGVESDEVKSLRNNIKDMEDMRSLFGEGSSQYKSVSNDIKDVEDMISILK